MADETITTSTERLMRQNRRQRRAEQLASLVMQRIMPYISEEVEYARKDAYNALFDVFHDQGVEFLTDFDRAEIGLQPRSPDGWTWDEIRALEKARLELLLRPIFVTMPKGDEK